MAELGATAASQCSLREVSEHSDPLLSALLESAANLPRDKVLNALYLVRGASEDWTCTLDA
jgi:hypothetical protein